MPHRFTDWWLASVTFGAQWEEFTSLHHAADCGLWRYPLSQADTATNRGQQRPRQCEYTVRYVL